MFSGREEQKEPLSQTLLKVYNYKQNNNNNKTLTILMG